jgi:hypothetical protein
MAIIISGRIHPSGGLMMSTPVIIPITLNPETRYVSAGTSLSNGNLTFQSSNQSAAYSTVGKSSGKWYHEVFTNSISNFLTGGVTPAANVGVVANPVGVGPAGSSYGIGTQLDKSIGTNVHWEAAMGGKWYGIALNLTDMQVSFIMDTGTRGPYTLSATPGTTYYAYLTAWGNYTSSINFGATAFVRTIPVGYTPWVV